MNELERISLDEIDKKILRILQESGDISNLELSKKVGLAPSSCLLRVKNLREHKFIKKVVTVVDEKVLGYNVMAFLQVELKALTKSSIDEFVKEITSFPQVLECYLTTGEGSFLVKIIAKDLDHYKDFVLNSLLALPFVRNVSTSVIVSVAKDTTIIPID